MILYIGTVSTATKVLQNDISRQVVRTFSKVKTSGMRSKFAVILHTSVYTSVNMCMSICTVSTYACTYVSDSRRQLDSIDAVAHPSRFHYAYMRIHSHIKGGVDCSFVFPRCKSGLPEQSIGSLSIWARYWPWPWWPTIVSFFYETAKRDFLSKAYGNIVSMREDSFYYTPINN